MNLLITGATGFIGTRLVQNLTSQGHHVTALTRAPGKAGARATGVDVVRWNPGERAQRVGDRHVAKVRE